MLSLVSLPYRVPRVEVSRPGPADLRSWCQTAARWPQLRAPVQTLRTELHPRWWRRCREAVPPPDRSLSRPAAPARLGKTTPPLRAVEAAIKEATAGGGRREHLLWSGRSRVFTLWSEENAFLAFGTELSLIPLVRAGTGQKALGCGPAPEGWWQKLRICCTGKLLRRDPAAVIRKGSWLCRGSSQRATLSFSARCHVLSPSSQCSPCRAAGKDTPCS